MIWILRFVPAQGSLSIDAGFQSNKSALDIFKKWKKLPKTLEFTDDFGISFFIPDCSAYSVILTNSEASAEMSRVLNQANNEAAGRQKAQIDVGSSLQ